MWYKIKDSHNEEIINLENKDFENYKPKVKKIIKEYDDYDEKKIKAEKIINEEISIESQTVYNIISNQNSIICFLSKYVKRSEDCNDINWEYIKQFYQYLYETSYYLSKTYLELEPKVFENILESEKPKRSSYKSCEAKHKCSYVYGNCSIPCNGDHYVHHKLSSDLKCLISFISEKKPCTMHSDLTTSNKTLSIVIENMFEQMEYFKNEKFDGIDCMELNSYYSKKNLKNFGRRGKKKFTSHR